MSTIQSKQLFTNITSQGQLEISLNTVDIPQPKPHQVVVKIEASPIIAQLVHKVQE